MNCWRLLPEAAVLPPKAPFHIHTHTSLLPAPGEPHNPSETGTHPWHIPDPNHLPGSPSPESELRSLQWPEDPVPHLILSFPWSLCSEVPAQHCPLWPPYENSKPPGPQEGLPLPALFLCILFAGIYHITSHVMARLLSRAWQPRAEIWLTFFHCSVASTCHRVAAQDVLVGKNKFSSPHSENNKFKPYWVSAWVEGWNGVVLFFPVSPGYILKVESRGLADRWVKSVREKEESRMTTGFWPGHLKVRGHVYWDGDWAEVGTRRLV